MKLENFISLRYIRKSGNNKDISAASFVVVISITLAIIFFICSVSIMNGYIFGIMKLAYEVRSFHAELYDNTSYEEALFLVSHFEDQEDVLLTDVYRETKALFSAAGKSTGVPSLRSLPESIFTKDANFDRIVRLDDGKKDLSPGGIMISGKTARKLRVGPGDKLLVTCFFASGESDFTVRLLEVRGIFSTGLVELDEQIAFIGNRTGMSMFKDNVSYNVFIKLKDVARVDEFARKNRNAGFQNLITWKDANYNEMTALSFEKNVIAFIVIIVVIVAVLNILTTVFITVLEKNQDIAILKSLGYAPGKIIMIFLFQGIYLGFIGIVLGVTLGLLLMKHLNQLMVFSTDILNFFNSLFYTFISHFIETKPPEIIEIFSKDFYLDKIYTEISLGEIILISFITLLFSILASIMPAVRASEIKPHEVIKNG